MAIKTNGPALAPCVPASALRRLSVAGAAAPWALNLAAMGEAAAATATDYKALVCVFLYGGNDYANTVVPYDTSQLQPLSLRMRAAASRYGHASADAPRCSTPPRRLAPAARTSMRWHPAMAPLAGHVQCRQAGRACSTSGRLVPADRASTTVHRPQIGTRCRPSCSRTTTSSRSGNPPRPKAPRSGWGGRIGDLLRSAATATRSSPAST